MTPDVRLAVRLVLSVFVLAALDTVAGGPRTAAETASDPPAAFEAANVPSNRRAGRRS